MYDGIAASGIGAEGGVHAKKRSSDTNEGDMRTKKDRRKLLQVTRVLKKDFEN